MAERESEKTDLEKIDKSIRITHIFVVSWIVVISLFYFLWFWFFNDKRLSDASADWGVAGDFFGGLLNPLVAYCAFYWLTKSVKLQKEELAETRASLTEAANAQRKQAEYAHISVRLNALSTLINSIMIEVETQRTQLQFLLEQVNQCKGGIRSIQGDWLEIHHGMELVNKINDSISKRMAERYNYEQEIKQLLKTIGNTIDIT